MSGTPPLWGGAQPRPPLQPRGTPLDENGSKYLAATEDPSSSLASNLHCKRLNAEPLSECTSENEPLNSVFGKRQRTKSGSETMEPLMDNNWNATECFNLKNETAPLCERNYRTMPKSEVPDIQLELDNSRLCNSQDNGVEINGKGPLNIEYSKYPNNCNDNFAGTAGLDNIESVNGNAGNLSPHCAATLEYVTQLPEGCSNSVKSKNVISEVDSVCKRFAESDDELEDDDNYLDSSETDDNDLDSCSVPVDEDEESCGEDDQSVISSVTVGSTSSLRSIASETVSSIYMNENGIASNEDGSLLYCHAPSSAPLNALNSSLFSHVPPTINFSKYNEMTAALPEEISRLLKWRFTTITPLIVRKTITNSGYKINKKTVLWCGTWGKHMKSPCFKGIKDYQKVNHFPGTFQIGRKDKLWKNFAKLQCKYGKEEFGFIPKTFVLPGDLNALKAAFIKEGVKKKWIIKPPASARGTGIQVVNKWSQLPVDTSVVVQRYISMPYLINNTKFDIRLYVLVTSFHPLRIFLYEDGLVRFASVQYQKTSKTLSDRFMHLTNYSVNKSSSSYTHNDDAGHCQGHKWTLKTLWGYLKAQEVDTGALWSRIVDLVIKTIIGGEPDIVIRTRKSTKSMYNCFELFGFDVILDEKLRPWLLEVNISPSLHSASSLDHSVKGPLIADLLNLVGYHIPDKLTQDKQVELLKGIKLGEKVSGLCLDRRIYTRLLTMEEQNKHGKINNLPRNQYLTSILENLLPDDIRHLIIAEDQLHRAGKFTCIFPTPDTHHYFGFLEKTRYYNRLMDAWENAYSDCREKGIDLLEGFCKEKMHLKVTQKFKLPKVVDSVDLSTPVRQRVCPQQTTFSPCSSPSAASQDTNLSMGETTPSPTIACHAKAVETRQERRKSRKCLKKFPKIVIRPLKPAEVSNYLNIQAVISGKRTPIPMQNSYSQNAQETIDKKLEDNKC